jgi:hypothetical protein
LPVLSSSSGGDISVTIIEKQENAAKMREQATKTKEFAESEKEELEEQIEANKEMIEESEQIIKETKTKLSELKQKEIEISTKMGTTEDGAAIDSYKAELIVITTSITQSRTIIRTSTETKIKYQESTSET